MAGPPENDSGSEEDVRGIRGGRVSAVRFRVVWEFLDERVDGSG